MFDGVPVTIDEMQAEISELRLLVRFLKTELDAYKNENARLKEENQCLKDEIAILKKQKPRPKIRPTHSKGLEARTNQPVGAIFKGIQKFTVQDIIFETSNTLYERERWLLPDGTYWNGELPTHINGHYGPALIAYILHEHDECRVTEPQLLRSLLARGILISAGQLSNLLIDNKEKFHEEKEELLSAGIEATGQIQVDDIGARHMGKNAYTTIN